MPVPVWGKAAPGERVSVQLSGNSPQATTAGADGRWSVRLPAQPAGGPFNLVIEGNNRIELQDVWFGEVWICSGQSNMERQLGPRPPQKPLENWVNEAASANYPKIRHFAVARTPASSPKEDTAGRWDVCSPQTVPEFTAVGYYFGRDLHQKLQVPIGLIHSSWGGTPAEAWMGQDILSSEFPEVLAEHETNLKRYPEQLAKYKAEEPALLKKWEEACAAATAAGNPMPRKPAAPKDPGSDQKRPSALHQGMIAPLQPYGIRGVIWYQGEGNAGRASAYRTIFPGLIRNWRKQWAQGEFPFLFVQIAPHQGMPPEIRDAQFATWRSTPNTSMVVTTDIGDATDIHPTRKEPVGARLALAARALAYGEAIEYSGPRFTGMNIEHGKAVVRFDHVGSGLFAKDGALRGFTISGDGKTFESAKAEIVGDTVLVSSESVPTPVAVRYAWSNVPDVNLFNKEGLPASPFRSDDPAPAEK
ncbi:MAG: sialate O-acetylesterase [Verrucomicrobiota bacterium]